MRLILKLGNTEEELEVEAKDISILVETLRTCTIIDPEGDAWKIDPAATLYFDIHPPTFSIDCTEEG